MEDEQVDTVGRHVDSACVGKLKFSSTYGLANDRVFCECSRGSKDGPRDVEPNEYKGGSTDEVEGGYRTVG